MNKKEMAQILAILRAAYPNTKSIDDPEATLNAYYLVLGDFSAESVMKAARLHMETSKFFPAPSEIRDKMVRAEIVYKPPECASNRLGDGNKEITLPNQEKASESKLEALCRSVGLGYDNDIEDDILGMCED